MIEYAKDMGLNLPLNPDFVDVMLHKRDLQVKRSKGEQAKRHLSYCAEGLSKIQDWKEVLMQHQKSTNGSILNSPSTTAAALIHLHDDRCLEYLRSVLKIYENAVPTIHPLDIYARLCLVDNLERLGTHRYFRSEIESILDETYRCWLQRDEDIFSDVACCAMGFRLLRMKGYEISSDALVEFGEKEIFLNSVSGQYKDVNAILELYKASQITIFQEEPILDKIHAWTSSFLKEELLNRVIIDKRFHEKVAYAVKYPHASLERLESRSSIEQYNLDSIQVLKTSYRCSTIENRDLLVLSVEDFNMCQSIHQKELKHLERWVKDRRLDHLKFARQKLTYAYFSITSVLFSPELSQARISWTKNAILTTVMDDFFDVGGTEEELVNITELIEGWEDGHLATNYCSEQVEIIFSVLQDTIKEHGAKASILQGRCIEPHLINIWCKFIKSMMREAMWVRKKSVPMMDVYMSNALLSFGLGPVVLITLYFLGLELPEEVVASPEYDSLFKHMSTCGRLLNDVQSFQREAAEGKLNSVSLYMLHSWGEITEEETVREMAILTERSRRELLQMVVQRKGSAVPKACKDLFWKTSRILHLFYLSNDGFTSSSQMIDSVNAVIHDPLSLPQCASC